MSEGVEDVPKETIQEGEGDSQKQEVSDSVLNIKTCRLKN